MKSVFVVPLETKLKQGTVCGVQYMERERYYFLINKVGTVSYMPASIIEAEYKNKKT